MWTFTEPTANLHWAAAAAAHLAAMALLVWFQELGQKLRREEHRAWWAGTGRDLLNGAGLAALGLSLWAGGFPGPAALLAGAAETLAVFGIYTFTSGRRLAHPRAYAIAAGVAVCLPALAFPGLLVALLAGAAHRLFPGAS
jgi:hypothetical protein